MLLRFSGRWALCWPAVSQYTPLSITERARGSSTACTTLCPCLMGWALCATLMVRMKSDAGCEAACPSAVERCRRYPVSLARAGTRGSEGSLARLTGCWVDSYEFKGWSNVVCVRRDHAMYPHFEMLSTRYRRYGGSYFVPG